ncbi:MAG: hypothetical protein AAF533_29135 [Acidobacteriota bacterium]
MSCCKSAPSLVSFVVLALLARPASAGDEAVWVPLGGPPGDLQLRTLVPLLPGDGVAVERMAGTFTTDDGGATWRSARLLQSGGGGVVVGNATLLLRTTRDALERSFDAGVTWERLLGGPDWSDVRGLAIVPDGGPIVALESQAAWVSEDDGETWSSLGSDWPIHNPGKSLAASRGAMGELVVLVGLESFDGLRRWDSITEAWSLANTGIETWGVWSIVVSPDGVDAGVWAVTGQLLTTVFRSRDGGRTWTQQTEHAVNVASLAVHPTEPDHLLLSSRDLLSRSRDGGETWEPLAGAPESYLGQVAFGAGDTLLAIGSSAWWSDDDGVSWRDVTAGLGNSRVDELVIGAPDGGAEVLLASTRNDGLRSLRRQVGREGAWESVSHPDAPSVLVMGAHPTQPGAFLTNSARHQLYQTLDGGESWDVLPGTGLINVARQIEHDPADPDTLLMWERFDVKRSVDGGLTWDETVGLEDHFVGNLVADRERAGRWLLSTQDRTTYEHSFHESVDGGVTWTLSPVPVPASYRVTIGHVAGNRLIALADASPLAVGPKVWLHDPDLGGWVDVDPGVPAERPDWWYPVTVASDPGDPEALVLATGGLGVWRSRDGGESWASWNLGPDAQSFDVLPDLIQHRPASVDAPPEVVVGTTNGAWSLSLDDSDLLLRVSRAGDDVVLEWPEPRLPVTVMRSEDPVVPLRAVGPATMSRSATDPVASDGRLYFYRARY